jgi:acetylglutamate kinase
MENLYVIKIGGNIIDDEPVLKSFLEKFAGIPGKKILVHGGGKLATRMAEKMGIPQQLVDGRRVTDAETLKIVTMVYAGYINKNIVASLQSLGCNAMGICGADGNSILAHKRLRASPVAESGISSGEAGFTAKRIPHPELTGTGAGKPAREETAFTAPEAGTGSTDYGFAGDIDLVNSGWIGSLLLQGLAVVTAPITHDGKNQLLNTNADSIAQEIAKAMSKTFRVQLIYSFEKAGVLLDVNDESTVIHSINPAYYRELKAAEKIFAGMIPKLDNAFAAISQGVEKVIIGKGEDLESLLNGKSGTTICHA